MSVNGGDNTLMFLQHREREQNRAEADQRIRDAYMTDLQLKELRNEEKKFK